MQKQALRSELAEFAGPLAPVFCRVPSIASSASLRGSKFPQFGFFFLSFGFYLGFAHVIGKVKDVKSIYFSFIKASDAADAFEGNLP